MIGAGQDHVAIPVFNATDYTTTSTSWTDIYSSATPIPLEAVDLTHADVNLLARGYGRRSRSVRVNSQEASSGPISRTEVSVLDTNDIYKSGWTRWEPTTREALTNLEWQTTGGELAISYAAILLRY